uniref:Polyprotein n=1 Tax=Cajanus cajan TaxID=3821 RepID=A0A151R5E2_CAJCA|nr:polyprotein [Cajanus cajan]
MSDSQLDNPRPSITHSSQINLTIPKSCKQTLSDKLENLIEYSRVPEDAQIESALPPLLSPYNVFRRHKSSFTWNVRKLVSTPRPGVKEFIQTTKMDQCALKATSAEQYVDLEINPSLIKLWQREGYVALHFGAVRLVLTLHGRKGLPVTARVSLIDSTFHHYEHAVIGSVLTTLNAGSVVLTIFPNFNVQLKDPTLPKRFKVQVQIVGAPQEEAALAATLHHQLIFRVQDHCYDLPTEAQFNENALMVIANSEDQVPTIVQIPKQISRGDLELLIPREWISNYESYRNDPTEASTSNAVFSTMMISLGERETIVPIYAFRSDGSSIYSDKINGHFMWDVAPEMCDSECDCWMDCSDDESDSDDSDSDKKDRCKPPSQHRKPPPSRQPWVAFRTPPRADVKPFVTKTEVTTDGRMKALSQAEEVLNWQTENVVAQNTWIKSKKMHISMDQDIKLLSTKLQSYHQELKEKIEQLEREIAGVKGIHKLSMEVLNKQRSLDKAKEQYEELVRLVEEKKHLTRIMIWICRHLSFLSKHLKIWICRPHLNLVLCP